MKIGSNSTPSVAQKMSTNSEITPKQEDENKQLTASSLDLLLETIESSIKATKADPARSIRG